MDVADLSKIPIALKNNAMNYYELYYFGNRKLIIMNKKMWCPLY